MGCSSSKDTAVAKSRSKIYDAKNSLGALWFLPENNQHVPGYKEVKFSDDVPLDHWTQMDWDLFCICQEFEMANWFSMSEKVQKLGEDFGVAMYTEEGAKVKKIEDDNDFFIADKDKNGRLNWEEFKLISKRIHEEDVRRLTDYPQWTPDQLEKRYTMLCALAKNKDGPSRHVMRKIPKMVLEYYFPIMTLKSEIKNPDAEDDSVERTWSIEEMGEVMALMEEDMPLLMGLPEKIQKDLFAYIALMNTNMRVKLDQQLFDLNNFKLSDKDGDGRLNFDEYLDFVQRQYVQDVKQFGQYFEKTQKHHERDYDMLCKLAYSQEGPTISTLVKVTNIVLVGQALMEVDKQTIHVEDDAINVDEWTDEQYQTCIELEKEDDELINKKMPITLREYYTKFLKECQYETFAREMQLLQDQQTFIACDEDKDGRLNFQEFKKHMTQRIEMFEAELGGKYFNVSEEYLRKRFEFCCDIGESKDGPSVRAFKKWANMWLKYQNETNADNE